MQQHDVAIIMYTSGTTGLPKGAMLTHGNILWNNINCMMAFGGSRDDVILTAAPLFHIGGLNVMTIGSFHTGSTLVLLRGFDAGLALQTIERHRVTHMFGAPAMFLFMSQQPQFAATDLSSIATIICGAAPVPESLIELYGARGVPFCQGYGLTETSPFSAFLTPEFGVSKLGSAGQPPLFSDTRIVDGDNRELPPGERGEICLRGPNIMKGYWNRPEATAAAIDGEGWFHSGDVGYVDEDGFLFICDRLKDMVISGGENVYPAEVEGVLYRHEHIAEVAVLGLPDEKWGEAVTAVVALHDGQGAHPGRAARLRRAVPGPLQAAPASAYRGSSAAQPRGQGAQVCAEGAAGRLVSCAPLQCSYRRPGSPTQSCSSSPTFAWAAAILAIGTR